MNYGKINNPIPSTLLTERDVLKSLLEKEEINCEKSLRIWRMANNTCVTTSISKEGILLDLAW